MAEYSTETEIFQITLTMKLIKIQFVLIIKKAIANIKLHFLKETVTVFFLPPLDVPFKICGKFVRVFATDSTVRSITHYQTIVDLLPTSFKRIYSYALFGYCPSIAPK